MTTLRLTKKPLNGFYCDDKNYMVLCHERVDRLFGLPKKCRAVNVSFSRGPFKGSKQCLRVGHYNVKVVVTAAHHYMMTRAVDILEGAGIKPGQFFYARVTEVKP